MFKNHLVKSIKFIGKGIGLICFNTGCEYVKGDSNNNRDIMFIHRWN